MSRHTESGRICIYCREPEGRVSFKGREHILPQFLGTFHDNLVLHGFVVGQKERPLRHLISEDFSRFAKPATHTLLPSSYWTILGFQFLD